MTPAHPSRARSKGKIVTFASVAAVLLLGLLELASWAVVSALHDDFGVRDLDALAYRPDEIKRSKGLFHPLLGWNRTHSTKWGVKFKPLP